MSIKQKKYYPKAQIHSGARGKAGGIKLCTNDEEIWNAADELLGKRLVTHQTGPGGKGTLKKWQQPSQKPFIN